MPGSCCTAARSACAGSASHRITCRTFDSVTPPEAEQGFILCGNGEAAAARRAHGRTLPRWLLDGLGVRSLAFLRSRFVALEPLRLAAAFCRLRRLCSVFDRVLVHVGDGSERPRTTPDQPGTTPNVCHHPAVGGTIMDKRFWLWCAWPSVAVRRWRTTNPRL